MNKRHGGPGVLPGVTRAWVHRARQSLRVRPGRLPRWQRVCIRSRYRAESSRLADLGAEEALVGQAVEGGEAAVFGPAPGWRCLPPAAPPATCRDSSFVSWVVRPPPPAVSGGGLKRDWSGNHRARSAPATLAVRGTATRGISLAIVTGKMTVIVASEVKAKCVHLPTAGLSCGAPAEVAVGKLHPCDFH